MYDWAATCRAPGYAGSNEGTRAGVEGMQGKGLAGNRPAG